MKSLSCIVITLSVSLCLLCAPYGALSETDKLWLLLPQDFPDTLFARYSPQKASGGKLFFFKKTKTSLSGFTAVYEQKLSHEHRETVLFTVQVSYARNETDARALYGNYLSVDGNLKDYVKKTDPSLFAVDDMLFIRSDRIFYLALRKKLVLYFVQIENCAVDLETTTSIIHKKIDFIERHAAAFKT